MICVSRIIGLVTFITHPPTSNYPKTYHLPFFTHHRDVFCAHKTRIFPHSSNRDHSSNWVTTVDRRSCATAHMPRITWPWTLGPNVVCVKSHRNFNDYSVSNHTTCETFNLLAMDFLFQILAHPVFKMWVIQKPNKVALWKKRHFEEEKMEIIQHV